MNKDNWNQRYSKDEFVYGTEPNKFFADQLQKLSHVKLLLLGEGEGRNAVFAAGLGWSVDAVDFSETARDKALKLAEEKSVEINYVLSEITEFTPKNKYDCIALIYLHLPPEIREQLHDKIQTWLNPNGTIILEAFDKDQLKYNSGGPKNIDLLYSLEDIFTDFQDLSIKTFSKEIITLTEGKHHSGSGVVIRYTGTKD